MYYFLLVEYKSERRETLTSGGLVVMGNMMWRERDRACWWSGCCGQVWVLNGRMVKAGGCSEK